MDIATNQHINATSPLEKNVISGGAQKTLSHHITFLFFYFSIISTIITTYNVMCLNSLSKFSLQMKNRYIFYLILPFLLVIISSLYLAFLWSIRNLLTTTITVFTLVSFIFHLFNSIPYTSVSYIVFLIIFILSFFCKLRNYYNRMRLKFYTSRESLTFLKNNYFVVCFSLGKIIFIYGIYFSLVICSFHNIKIIIEMNRAYEARGIILRIFPIYISMLTFDY